MEQNQAGDIQVVRKWGRSGYYVEVWDPATGWSHVEWCLTKRGARRVARKAHKRATDQTVDQVVWTLTTVSSDGGER